MAVIGVDLGGTKLLAGAVEEDGSISHQLRRRSSGLERDALLAMVVAAVEEIRGEVGGELEAVGFGIPCTFDFRTGRAVMAVHLPLFDVPFAAIMRERLGVPVAADNDATCATLAEARLGRGRDAEHVVMLTVGTGIGGGLVLGGRLYRGWVGGGGELGHMVVDLDGPPCNGHCPNRGCLEAVASGTALAREALSRAAADPGCGLGRAAAAGSALDGELVTRLAAEGDPSAREVVALIGRRLGVGLSSLVNVFQPEVLVVGGGVSTAGELLLGPARAVMSERALHPGRELVRVELARFGEESGLVGAALLAREEAV